MNELRRTFWESWPFALALMLALALRAATWPLSCDVDTACFMLISRAMALDHQHLYADLLTNHSPMVFALGEMFVRAAGPRCLDLSRAAMILASASLIVPIFLVGRRIAGRNAALLACFLFALDPLSIFYAGALHVSELEAIAATWCLFVFVVALDRERRHDGFVFLAGATAGVAFTVKQSSAVLPFAFFFLSAALAPGLVRSWSLRRPLRDLPPFVAGYALALVPWVLYFASQGILPDAWHSLLGMNLELRRSDMQAQSLGALSAKISLLQLASSADLWLWAMAAIGFLVSLRQPARMALLPVAWLAAFAAFLAFGYYEAYPHYLLPWVPALALLGGIGGTWVISVCRDSLAEDHLRHSTRLFLLLAAIAAMLLGVKLLELRRGDYASVVFVGGLTLGALAAAPGGRPFGSAQEKRPCRWDRFSRAGFILALAAAVFLGYWSRREIYWIPENFASNERQVARAVNKLLRPGDNVAVFAPDNITLYGGWSQLPIVRNGKMWVAGGLSSSLPMRPDNQLVLQSTFTLWREYEVRFLIVRQDHWMAAQAEENREFLNFVEANYRLVRVFSWPNISDDESLRLYEKLPTAK